MSVNIVRLTLVVTAGAYSANDVVGGRLNFGVIPAHRTLRAVKLTDLAAQAGAYQLILFDSEPTNIADNAPFDIADADLPKIVAAVHLTDTAGADAFSFTDNKAYMRQGLDIPIEAATLYGFLIALGTPTYAATGDVRLALHLSN